MITATACSFEEYQKSLFVKLMEDLSKYVDVGADTPKSFWAYGPIYCKPCGVLQDDTYPSGMPTRGLLCRFCEKGGCRPVGRKLWRILFG